MKLGGKSIEAKESLPMRWFRSQLGQSIRLVTIVATVLGLVRVPLPQLDYHSIRHQDGPGEVCTYHDHLLRWHPQTIAHEEITVLHWHWFTPTGTGASLPESPADQDGPAWHALVPVPEAVVGDNGQCVLSGHEPEPISRVVATSADLELMVPPPRSMGLGRDGLVRLPGFAATFAPSTARSALLSRWNC